MRFDDPNAMLYEDPDARATPRTSKDPDAETVAEALASGGRRVCVSFDFAAPPAVSRLRVDFPGLPDATQIWSQIIAAHEDSVLIHIDTRTPGRDRKPKRVMPVETTALLRRGDDDLLVAQLTLCDGEAPVEAELCLLRSGACGGSSRVCRSSDDSNRQDVFFWETDAVIPSATASCTGWTTTAASSSRTRGRRRQLRYVSLPVEPSLKRRPRHHAPARVIAACAPRAAAGGEFRGSMSPLLLRLPGRHLLLPLPLRLQHNHVDAED
ncbi:hypothetical protein ZWY2020_002836 [Hordeum vulgare]|nr:hypothetical protein ZWY2020_002836 [Hordeum vulgare]